MPAATYIRRNIAMLAQPVPKMPPTAESLPRPQVALGATPVTDGRPIDGIGVYTLELECALRSLDCCDVRRVAFNMVRHPFRSGDPSICNRLPPFPLACLGMYEGAQAYMERALPKGTNVFHATDYRIPRLRRTPVVATLHDAVLVTHPHWIRRGGAQLKRLLLLDLVKQVSQVIAISNHAAELAQQHWHVPANRITVVRHGIAADWHEPISKQQLERTMGLHGLKPGYVLFVGTFQPRKNVARIIRAHRKLPADLREAHPLVLVGRRGWRCEDVDRELRVPDRYIRVLGHLSHEQLRALYTGAGMLAFPSLEEGAGLPILEAFACKTAVLTSNISAMPETADGGALLVDPLATEEIAEGMRHLLTDETSTQRLIARGQKVVRATSWEQCARETYKVYTQA